MIYGYDHWNMNVQAALPGVVITIADHPIPDGTNLMDIYGAPNCVGDCVYYSDESQFLALLSSNQTYTKREKLWHIEANLFDNLWLDYAFAAGFATCGDIDNLASCTYDAQGLVEFAFEAVAITEGADTEYYEAMARVPILGLAHGDYVYVRYDPT